MPIFFRVSSYVRIPFELCKLCDEPVGHIHILIFYINSPITTNLTKSWCKASLRVKNLKSGYVIFQRINFGASDKKIANAIELS